MHGYEVKRILETSRRIHCRERERHADPVNLDTCSRRGRISHLPFTFGRCALCAGRRCHRTVVYRRGPAARNNLSLPGPAGAAAFPFHLCRCGAARHSSGSDQSAGICSRPNQHLADLGCRRLRHRLPDLPQRQLRRYFFPDRRRDPDQLYRHRPLSKHHVLL